MDIRAQIVINGFSFLQILKLSLHDKNTTKTNVQALKIVDVLGHISLLWNSHFIFIYSLLSGCARDSNTSYFIDNRPIICYNPYLRVKILYFYH